jgi:hypothetical protein
MHGNLLDVTGTGAPSGARYIVTGFCMLAGNSPPLLPYICDNTMATLGPGFQLIPDPSCPHAQIQVNGEVAFNMDGTQNPTPSRDEPAVALGLCS